MNSKPKLQNVHEKLYQDIFILYSNPEFFTKYMPNHLVLEVDGDAKIKMNNYEIIIETGDVIKELHIGYKLYDMLDSWSSQQFKEKVDFGSFIELLSYPNNYHIVPTILERNKDDFIDFLHCLSKEQAQELCDPLLAEHIINYI
jgi:hypothetical protein